MANSVSKINVVVGAQTGQLQSGMREASATVKSGMSNIQSTTQQAMFAVDDFFAAFSTGGVAGGLRGAGNNLTMIASTLGGIKAQLLVIAGLAVGQLVAKMFSGATKDAEELRTEISKIADAMNRVREARESRISAIDEIMGSGRGQSAQQAASRLNEIRAGIVSSRGMLDRLQADRQEVAGRFIPGEAEGATEVAARFKAIRDEELKDIDSKIAAEQRNLDILNAQEWAQGNVARRAREAAKAAKDAADVRQQTIDKQFQFKPFITGEMRSAIAGEAMDIDKEIQQLRESMRASLSMNDVFRMMPGINSMGSAGAVGAINAAMVGPMNARDSGPALARETNNILKRIEELEKKKKGLVEVVGL